MTQPALLAVLAVVGVLVVALAAIALVLASRTARLLRETQGETAHLRVRLERVESRATRASDTPSDTPADSWLITDAGTAPQTAPDPGSEPEPVTLEPRLFAHTVLRESVVRAAGLGHGVRRALAPEVRDRIRREMRRELRRARKQRKVDLREARRAWAAAERAREAA